MGHWMELTKLNVSEEAMMRCYAENYGQDNGRMAEMQADVMSKSGAARAQAVQQWSSKMVQQSAPCEYSNGYGKSKGGSARKGR